MSALISSTGTGFGGMYANQEAADALIKVLKSVKANHGTVLEYSGETDIFTVRFSAARLHHTLPPVADRDEWLSCLQDLLQEAAPDYKVVVDMPGQHFHYWPGSEEIKY